MALSAALPAARRQFAERRYPKTLQGFERFAIVLFEDQFHVQLGARIGERVEGTEKLRQDARLAIERDHD